MARVRSRNTAPEELLRRALWALGLRYRLRPDLPGTPDLAFPGVRLAVFVDGCFWHGCPSHYTAPVKNGAFWQAKLDRNMARDRRVDEELAARGWRSLRLWEHDVTASPTAAAERVGRLSRTEWTDGIGPAGGQT
jgi:DNA mismatch endonuclease (patch repair protein)